ncbi:unnamed protein product, partial [Iphiclides podalirius]
MMDVKIWVLFAIVNIVRSRDIVVGTKDGGRKIYDENKQASPAIWRQTENVTIAANDTEVIRGIVITDLRVEKDGDAKIVEGGEGQKNVTIELKSPTVLRGYEFHIEAYAIPEDTQTTTGNSNKYTQTIVPAEQSSETPSPNAVGLGKQLTSSTTQGSPTNVAIINHRQNRDTENKDMTTQEVKMLVPLLTKVTTTEMSKLPSGETSTPLVNRDIKNLGTDHKYPTVNREIEDGNRFDHPRVNIYEVSKMPESTARNIPSTYFRMPQENSFTQGVHANDDKTVQTPLNMNKMHTHIRHPQFAINDSKQSPEPMANTGLSSLEHDNKKEDLRHKRDVDGEKKDNPRPIGVDHKVHNVKTNPVRNETVSGTMDVKSSSHISRTNFENNQGQGFKVIGTEMKHISNEQTQRNTHRDQDLHKSFRNIADVGASSVFSSTEMNKIYASLPTGAESVQTDGKFNKYSQHKPIEMEQSSSTSLPVASLTTDKSSSSNIEKLANSKLKSKMADPVNTDNSHDSKVVKETKRNARDTTGNNKKDASDSLQPSILNSSSTTIKPGVISKNLLEDHVTNTAPKEVSPKNNETNKNYNPTMLLQTGVKDRTARDAYDEKEKHNVPNTSRTGINTSGVSETIITKQPISEQQNSVNSSKVNITTETTTIGEDKERQTRDTSSENTPKKAEALSMKAVAEEFGTKLQINETEVNTEKFPNLVKKTSSTTDDRINKNKEEETKARVSNEAGEDTKANMQIEQDDANISPKVDYQLPKIAREVSVHDVSLATDLKVESTDKPTTIRSITKAHDEKEVKKPNSEVTAKPKEKPN